MGNRFKYVGHPNPDFVEEWYTIEHAHPEYDIIKFAELSFPINCNFFISNFDEISPQALFHEKFVNEVLVKKDDSSS